MSLSIPWAQLKSSPVKITIKDIYLLALPSPPDHATDPAESENRAQAAKIEKLRNVELMGVGGVAGTSG